jgi:hypothetical protein
LAPDFQTGQSIRFSHRRSHVEILLNDEAFSAGAFELLASDSVYSG